MLMLPIYDHNRDETTVDVVVLHVCAVQSLGAYVVTSIPTPRKSIYSWETVKLLTWRKPPVRHP